MEIKRTDAWGTNRAFSKRIKRFSPIGTTIRPIPVAIIDDPLNPLIGRGDMAVSPEKSFLSKEMCVEAPVSKIKESSGREARALILLRTVELCNTIPN